MFAEPLRDQIRNNAEQLAKQSGLEVEYIERKKAFRKEDRIQEILEQRGDHPGLVHIFSAIEPCTQYAYRFDPKSKNNYLYAKSGKCLHYYFYFIHELLGLCFLRVPTWVPFHLEFYCNAHNYLAARMCQEGIPFTQVDNTFTQIGDFARAQTLADEFSPEVIRKVLDDSAKLYCPASQTFTDMYPESYHWSIRQVEYSTDIIFKSRDDLRRLYDPIIRTAIHAVKAQDVTTFLGRKLNPLYEGQVGTNFHTRIEGTRIKHSMGPASIKMYDKDGIVLRIETTTYDVSFFKHYREVVHRDGTKEMKITHMKKTIYSLPVLSEVMLAANKRYLHYLSDLTDPSAGIENVEELSRPAAHDGRTFRGFNLFDSTDLELFVALAHGEWNISGFYNATLRRVMPDISSAQLSRILRRLREHKLITKHGKTYKYYFTKFGRQVAFAALKLREFLVIPSLAAEIFPS
jgi:hypothetical protein